MYPKEWFLDNNFEIAERCEKAQDRHGNMFTVVVSGGVLENKRGMPQQLPAYYSSEELAWKEFENSLLTWLNGRRRIHIRTMPTLETHTFYNDSGLDPAWAVQVFTVRCRLTAY